MFDYTLLGSIVQTPAGPGQYLEHKNGKVLVVMDWECPPVEFSGDEVFLIQKEREVNPGYPTCGCTFDE
mgnify:CR=1 FL=1